MPLENVKNWSKTDQNWPKNIKILAHWPKNISKVRKVPQNSYSLQKTQDLPSKSYWRSPNLLGTSCPGAATISSSGSKPKKLLTFNMHSQRISRLESRLFCLPGSQKGFPLCPQSRAPSTPVMQSRNLCSNTEGEYISFNRRQCIAKILLSTKKAGLTLNILLRVPKN